MMAITTGGNNLGDAEICCMVYFVTRSPSRVQKVRNGTWIHYFYSNEIHYNNHGLSLNWDLGR